MDKNKNIKFYNYPQKMERADYEEVCKQVVDDLKNNPNVESIYLLGGDWVPGVSDLDFIIVFKDKNIVKQNIRMPWTLSEKAKCIFNHGYDTLDLKNFRNLFYLFSLQTKSKLVYGKDLTILNPEQELSEKEINFLEAGIIFDMLIRKLLILPRYKKFKEIDAKKLTGEIYSVVYTLKMINNVTGKEIGLDFISATTALRQNWFLVPQEENLEKLISLLDVAINLVLDTTVLLGQFVSQNLIETDTQRLDDRIRFYDLNRQISFKKDHVWNKEIFLDNFYKRCMRIPFLNIENFELILPLSLAHFFMVYAQSNNSVGKIIRKYLNRKPQRLSQINAGLQKHIVAMNEIIDSAKNNFYLTRIPIFFDYASINCSKKFFIIRILSILRKLRIYVGNF